MSQLMRNPEDQFSCFVAHLLALSSPSLRWWFAVPPVGSVHFSPTKGQLSYIFDGKHEVFGHLEDSDSLGMGDVEKTFTVHI